MRRRSSYQNTESVQRSTTRRSMEQFTAGSANVRTWPPNNQYRGHRREEIAVAKSAFIASTFADDAPEMKYMYTNAPAQSITRMPHMFQAKVMNSRQWQWERAQGLETTACWAALFPMDDTQDVSFSIWCGHDDGYELINMFGCALALSS